MFAVGHMSFAYLLGKTSGRLLKTSINLPLIVVLSILPDVDIIVETLFGVPFHRGPTHSVIFAFLIFVPFFLVYKKKALPYFFSLVSHSLFADFLVGGNIQLFWPLSESLFQAADYGISLILITDFVNVALEFGFFISALVVMLVSRDFLKFFTAKLSNLLLFIPIVTVLLPTFISYPLAVPDLLILPHVFFLMLFAISGLIGFKKIFFASKIFY